MILNFIDVVPVSVVIDFQQLFIYYYFFFCAKKCSGHGRYGRYASYATALALEALRMGRFPWHEYCLFIIQENVCLAN